MDTSRELTETQSLLTRMVDAITAAQTQTAWPAEELAELADEVLASGSPKVWALS
jgi:hypothetical protein